MSEHANGIHRDQTVLFPNTIDQYVEKENPVRFIDAFVDSLNLEKLGFNHSMPADTGRPSYDPADLLKLYMYGYLNQVRSSRKLEKECHRNVEVMWLMKKLAPDHKTIADFRKDNVDCIKGVFKEFVYLCRSLRVELARRLSRRLRMETCLSTLIRAFTFTNVLVKKLPLTILRISELKNAASQGKGLLRLVNFLIGAFLADSITAAITQVQAGKSSV
jgi:transposase